MATTHLQIPDIAASQNQKEVTANAAHDLLDKAVTQLLTPVAMASDVVLTAVQQRENAYLELTGTPSTDRNLNMFDTNAKVLTVFNNCDSQVTIRNSASGGSDQPVIAPGTTVTFHYDGTDFIESSRINTAANIGFMPLPLESLRDIGGAVADDIGTILDTTTTPTYRRINLATDKGLRIEWTTSNNDEIQFPSVPMPPDLDDSKDLTIHLVAEMDGGTDTPTIDIQVYDGIGDTEMGSATATITSTLAEKTVTIVAANLTGHPLGFLSVSLLPVGAHTTNTIRLYAAWIEYTKK